jgi:hypothetical protein
MPGTRNARLWLAVVVFLVGFVGTTFLAAAGEVEEEYARRLRKLAPDDVNGHFRLAMWCKEKQAWALVQKECTHVLLLEPDHEQAKLLLELAKRVAAGRGTAWCPAWSRMTRFKSCDGTRSPATLPNASP